MKHLSYFLLAVLLLLSGGCAGILYPLTDRDLLPEQVNLTPGSYRVVREVSGRTHALYVLGIGGMKAKPRESYDQMVARAALAPNQTIVNVKTEQRIRGWLGSGRWSLVAQHDIITYGTVIEFVEDSIQTSMVSPASVISVEQPSPTLIQLGDNCPFRELLSGKEFALGDEFILNDQSFLIADVQDGKYLIIPKVLCDIRMNWNDAAAYCASLGGGWGLATIEQYNIVNSNARSLSIHLGLSRYWTADRNGNKALVFMGGGNSVFYKEPIHKEFRSLPVLEIDLH